MANPRSFLASGQIRAFAYLIDVSAACLLLLLTALGGYVLDTASTGAFELGLLLFILHAYFLAFKSGGSIGKHLLDVRVTNADGRPLSWIQCGLRAALIALPWLLLGIADNPMFRPDASEYEFRPFATIGVMLLLADVLLMEYTPSRQSLTDRLSRTIVVKVPPVQPHKAPAIPMFSSNDLEFGHPPKQPKDKGQ